MVARKSKSLEARLLRAKTFAETWRTVAPSLTLDELDVDRFDQIVESLERSYMLGIVQEKQLNETRNGTEKQADEAEQIEKNLRSTAKIRFGADSLQYGQLGGVRTSERKRPARRKTNPATRDATTPPTP